MRGRGVTWAVLGLSLAAHAASPANQKPKLVVLDLTPGTGVDASVASGMTAALTSEISDKGYFQVLSSNEVKTLMGLERQRQMMGCEEQESCMAELAGALGAQFVLTGSLTKLGETYQLALQTLDSRKAQPLGRSTKLANSLESLHELLPYAAADATATPPPPQRSHALQYGLMGAGGLAAVGSGIVFIQALSLEASTRKELELGQSQPSVLRPAGYYEDVAGRIRMQKTLSAAAAGVAAALVASGLYLELRARGRSGTQAALVPTSRGVALVGGFP